MTGQAIYLETRGAIAELVLNRPDKRNALSAAMWRAIPTLVGEAGAHPEVKVLILRGATAEAFSAGADIAEFGRVHASAATARDYHAVVGAAYEALALLAKPTIAMVRGACFGGGCALALCCDIRYADPSVSFCIPPARLGLTYSLGETKRLVDLIGPSRAKEMLMGARVILAEEALRIGLATRLFAAADLDRETLAFAEQLCGLSQFTIRAVKQVIAEIQNGAVAETELSRRLLERQFEGPDYLEGRRAFLEKREPRFTWR
jgi:enoyl-CoA hydratase